MTRIKEILTAGVGALGGLMSWLYGGFGDAMLVLIVFMALDYMTGLIVAGVFHKSSKSETGALESKAGWKGLCRKGMTLGIVMMAALLDRIMGTAYIRDAVVVGFIFNESLSILENAGLMGVSYPRALKNALDLLNQKGEEKHESKDE
ncbi:MAG: phage holin family protein [Eubacteriales bacterium]|nr:phage holin family protein [Eubacteriales bacterium]